MRKLGIMTGIALAVLFIVGIKAFAAPLTHCTVFLGQTVCWFANDHPTGTAVEAVPQAGQVKVWYKYPSHANPIRIFVSSGSQMRYFDLNQASSGMALTMDVAAGDTISIGACDIYYGGNPTSFNQCLYPSMGWQERVSNWVCQASPNPYARGAFDFTDLEAAVEAQGLPIFSRQCWGDYQEDTTDVDFNDFVLILSYERTFSGYHDGRSGVIVDPSECRALGWARYDQDLSRDLRYRVLVDGVEAASGVANRFRSDLTSVCSGGTCAYSANLSLWMLPNLPHTLQVQAQNFMTGEWFNLSGTPKTLTCLDSSTATPALPPTPTQTATSPPVATVTPTWTPAPSLTPTQISPFTISLTVEHSQLIYFGPMLGQPAQRLSGEARGGSASNEIIFSVRSPAGLTMVYRQSSSGGFSLDTVSSGDIYFGTRETGTWTAWAVGTDDSGRTGTSPTVTWEVSWWPVHGRP